MGSLWWAAGAAAAGAGDAVNHRAGAALAIGAGNGDHGHRGNEAHCVAHARDPFQSERDGLRMLPLDVREPVTQRLAVHDELSEGFPNSSASSMAARPSGALTRIHAPIPAPTNAKLG